MMHKVLDKFKMSKEYGKLAEEYDRYTFFGKEPEEIISSRGNALVITKNDGTQEVRNGNPLERLKEYYSEFDIVKDNEELSFSGGLVGNLGYDFVRYAEVLPDNNPDEIGIETVQMMLMTKFIMVDHVAETLTGIILGEDTPEGRKKSLEEAEELIRQALANKGRAPEKNFTHDGVIVNQSDSLEQYSQKVEKIKEYIREGHIFQTVLSQRWTIETKQSGFELYKELRELNPSPYLYYFNYGDFEVIGSSPEMIVKQQGNRVYTCPIAGTRKRGADAEEDALLRDELLQDEKERAEHAQLIHHLNGSNTMLLCIAFHFKFSLTQMHLNFCLVISGSLDDLFQIRNGTSIGSVRTISNANQAIPCTLPIFSKHIVFSQLHISIRSHTNSKRTATAAFANYN